MKHALNNLLLRVDNMLSAQYQFVFQLHQEISKRVNAMNGKITDLVNDALYGFTNNSDIYSAALDKQVLHTIITNGDLSNSDSSYVRSIKGTARDNQISEAVTKLKRDLKQYIDEVLPQLLDSTDGNRNSIILKNVKGNLCFRLYVVAGGTEQHFYPLVDSLF
jgi:hypothetical protein